MVSRIARRVDFLIIYFEIQKSEFEFTFFSPCDRHGSSCGSQFLSLS